MARTDPGKWQQHCQRFDLQHRVDRAWVKSRDTRVCDECGSRARAGRRADRAGQWTDLEISGVGSGCRSAEPPSHVLPRDWRRACSRSAQPSISVPGSRPSALGRCLNTMAWPTSLRSGPRAGAPQCRRSRLDPLADANKSIVVGGVIVNSLFGAAAQVQPGQGCTEIHEEDVTELGTGGSLQTEDRTGGGTTINWTVLFAQGWAAIALGAQNWGRSSRNGPRSCGSCGAGRAIRTGHVLSFE